MQCRTSNREQHRHRPQRRIDRRQGAEAASSRGHTQPDHGQAGGHEHHLDQDRPLPQAAKSEPAGAQAPVQAVIRCQVASDIRQDPKLPPGVDMDSSQLPVQSKMLDSSVTTPNMSTTRSEKVITQTGAGPAGPAYRGPGRPSSPWSRAGRRAPFRRVWRR
jgi:hypothetical protein